MSRDLTHICPACGTRLDGVIAVGGGATPMPEPGDVTVCFSCTQASVFLEFQGQLLLRQLSAEEVAAEPEIARWVLETSLFRTDHPTKAEKRERECH